MAKALSVIGENNNANGNNPFVSEKDLDAGLLGDLEKASINRGTAFMSNQATSAFTTSNSKGDSVLSVGSSGAGVAGSALGGVGNILSGANLTVGMANRNAELMERFTKVFIQTSIADSARIITTHATKMALLPIKLIADTNKRTSYWFSYWYPILLAEKTASLNKNAEDLAEESEKNSQAEQEEKNKKSLTEKLNDMQNNVNKFMNSVQEPLQNLSSYIGEGPQWLMNQGNKILERNSKNINEYCIGKYDEAYKDEQKMAEDKAQKKGKSLAEKKANAEAEKLKKLQDKKEALAEEQNAKAKAKSKKALLKVKGLMGA